MIKFIFLAFCMFSGITFLIVYGLLKEPPIKPGTCFSEINMGYISGGDKTEYRIEKIYGNFYDISTWQNKKWIFIGKKKETYFKDSKRFKYERVTCPDELEKDKLTDQLDMKQFKF